MYRKIFAALFFTITFACVHAQDSAKKKLMDLFGKFSGAAEADSLSNEAIKDIFFTEVLKNDIAYKALQRVLEKSASSYTFIRDLNIKPKTFQSGSMGATLGLEYNYDNSWTKITHKKNALFIQDYSLAFNGNLAFKKQLNPNSFLESTFAYNGVFSWGGMPHEIDDATSDKIEALEDSILARRERHEPYMDLYKQVNSFITVSDQFYLGIKGKLGYETNQDFSKQQFAPGILIGLGAKGWNKNEALRYLNILDYPFAFIRLLTGTDKTFTVYGATFPSFIAGLDYVVPGKDKERKALIGNEDPFSRLRFEAAFKTRVAHIGKSIFNFSADYRWYNELNAADAIKNSGLARSHFFVAAIESGTGLFISYTAGKLPFDRKNDQVYALGFKYDLGNITDK